MIKSLLIRLRASRLGVNTLWVFVAQGARILIQAVYFVLIARTLGKEQYGAFLGVGALAAIVTPFVGLGSGKLLIRNVARTPGTFPHCWGKLLLMTSATGPIFLLLILAGARLILPDSIPLSLVLLVAGADVLFYPLVDLAGEAFQAVQLLNKTAIIQVIPNLLRLAAIALLSICIQAPSALQWGCLYLITAMVSAIYGVRQVHRHIGTPVFCLPRTRAELKEGFYFAVGNSAMDIYNDIDKTMLARLSTLDATGTYGAAYKIIDVGFSPVRSLLCAGYARFFQHGESGIRGSLSFAKRVFPHALIYGLTGSILVALTAPLIPHILGSQFTDTVGALRWLSPILTLRAIHYFAADTLTGADFQGIRSGIQVIVALFNVGLNLWLIPLYSWHGACLASIASDGLLAVLLCITVFCILKAGTTASSPKTDGRPESLERVA